VAGNLGSRRRASNDVIPGKGRIQERGGAGGSSGDDERVRRYCVGFESGVGFMVWLHWGLSLRKRKRIFESSCILKIRFGR
jgi:hypothetical protein